MVVGVQVVVSKYDMKIKVPRKNHTCTVSAVPIYAAMSILFSAVFAKLK